MSHEQALREQAARYLALALRARENGNLVYADQLTTRANDLLEEADQLRHVASRPPEPPQHVPQQQQQTQPKKDNKED
jgi:hypothetical protein